MRYLIIFLLALVLLSCKDLEVKRYEYHTTTMMGKTVMTIDQDSVVVDFNGRGNPTHFSRETKDSEWSALKTAVSGVDFSKVADLEAPSNKRATDAAPFAKFVFVTKDSSFVSASFDHKNPHEMLMPLMKEVLQIEQENNR